MKNILVLSILVFAFSISSCSMLMNRNDNNVNELKLISEYDLPFKFQFRNTTVGGLSSIEYDIKQNQYYLVCDDRAEFNPVRYYTAKISLDAQGIKDVSFTNVTYLLDRQGKPYSDRKADPSHIPDPEALRYNPVADNIVWSSEGERTITKQRIILQNPSITACQLDGSMPDTFALPRNLHTSIEEQGPRNNASLEGIAFADNFRTLYASVEEPLYEDGSRAGTGDSAAWIRIVKYDVASRKPLAQYAYKIEPVVHPANPPGAFKLNGISDIMTLNNHQLLVTERSFSVGSPGSNIRLYLAELNGAGDVSHTSSLLETPPIHPIRKKLLLNMDSLHRFIDNVEGATWGPLMIGGKRSIVLVTDDNFSPAQKTQFFLLEVN
jgi:hypothetical protein